MSLTQIDDRGLKTPIDLLDNEKIRFGTGNDLELFHDGSHSIIKNTTGSLYAATGAFLVQNAAQTESQIISSENGSVQLFYDNSLKLQTGSGGIVVSGSYYTNDNNKLILGSDNDLQIYHNGSHNYIESTSSAATYLWGGGAQLRAVIDGTVELYYDGSKKLETTSTGVQVTGNIDIDGNIDAADGSKIKLGTGDDFQIYHDGSHSILKNDTGELKLLADQFRVNNNANNEQIISSSVNGNVEIYYDGYKKFETYSSGINITGHCRPSATDTYDCGINGAKWDDVYATNGTIQTSDRNEKNTIVDSDLGLAFVNKLKPVSYKFNNKTRTHYGLIAQDIETVLSDISKPTSGFAGFIKEDDSYGLRYNEFISPLIKAVQELSTEVETLKTKVAALENA